MCVHMIFHFITLCMNYSIGQVLEKDLFYDSNCEIWIKCTVKDDGGLWFLFGVSLLYL
jgi:hypothetical protein